MGAGLLAFFLLVTAFVIRPWWFGDPGAEAYGSSLRREMNYSGSGNCEKIPAVDGVWSCAISEEGSDYSTFLLKETGGEGCWTARHYDLYRPAHLGHVAGGRCAGFLDKAGLFSSDFMIDPVPKKLLESTEFKEWANQP